MRKNILDFIRRGLVACGFGPIVLAVVYLILHSRGLFEVLTVNQVCTGIFSLSALAFIAGGMNVLYQIERIPVMTAVLIHGVVLYVSYLGTYIVNGWIELGTTPFLVFSVIFVVGYLAIWIVIFSLTKKKTDRLNKMLKEKQRGEK